MAVIDIVSIVVGALVIIGMVAICIIVENHDKIKQKLYNILLNLSNYVTEAETMFAQGQGEAKLKYVLSRVKVDCMENHVRLTEEMIKTYIERILSAPSKKAGYRVQSEVTRPQEPITQGTPVTQVNRAPPVTPRVIPGQPRPQQNKGV